METAKRKPDTRILAGALIALLLPVLFLVPQTGVEARLGGQAKPTPRAALRYREFRHDTKAHQAQCSTCHKFPSANWKKVRPAATAFPDITEYPTHNSCTRCHAQQFFRGPRPAICSVCHTNPGPRNNARHPFPNPREVFDKSPKGKTATSDFAVRFPHDKHVDIVSAHSSSQRFFINASLISESRRSAEESCAVCHQTMLPQGESPDEYVTKPPVAHGDAFWIKKGMFKTSPVGHTTCFTCHSLDSGIPPEPKNCSECHQLKVPQPPADVDPLLIPSTGAFDKVMLDAWWRRDSSGTFRHEWFSHAELSCSTCHNIQTLKTAEPATKKVSIAACAACHATPTTDDGGAINFELDARKADRSYQCVKCHTSFGKLPVPRSHEVAVTGN